MRGGQFSALSAEGTTSGHFSLVTAKKMPGLPQKSITCVPGGLGVKAEARRVSAANSRQHGIPVGGTGPSLIAIGLSLLTGLDTNHSDLRILLIPIGRNAVEDQAEVAGVAGFERLRRDGFRVNIGFPRADER